MISITLLLCYISRALHVYPLLSAVNLYRWARFRLRKEWKVTNENEIGARNRYSLNTMHAVFFAGLRGAGKCIF